MARRLVIAALVMMLAGLQWRLWVSDGGLTHTHRLRVQVEVQAAENERLRSRNAALDAEVQDLKSGVAAIEARARSTLGMIRPGESFYLVVD
jgi:cell division protein FtsB